MFSFRIRQTVRIIWWTSCWPWLIKRQARWLIFYFILFNIQSIFRPTFCAMRSISFLLALYPCFYEKCFFHSLPWISNPNEKLTWKAKFKTPTNTYETRWWISFNQFLSKHFQSLIEQPNFLPVRYGSVFFFQFKNKICKDIRKSKTWCMLAKILLNYLNSNTLNGIFL